MLDRAFGLRRLRPGFAHSEGLDRAFALGWPHLHVVGPDPLGDALPSRGGRWIWSAEEALDRVRPKLVSAGLAKEGSLVDHALALAFARHVVPFGLVPGFAETDFFLLEGLVGSEVLAEAMISALETTAPATPSSVAGT
jgi:hypothetical protein